MNILISACLLGVCCRYDGGSALSAPLLELAPRHNMIPVCPEQLGGLPTPRQPAEIRGERVLGADGTDLTGAFEAGARETLRLARLYDCSLAILKEGSPSCGFGWVYDGTFSDVKVEGNGVAAALLHAGGVTIMGAAEAEKGLDL